MNVNPNTRSTLSPPLSHSQCFFKYLALAPRRRRGSARHFKKTLSERERERVERVFGFTFIPTHMQSHTYVVSFRHVPVGRAINDVLLSFIGRGTNVQVRG